MAKSKPLSAAHRKAISDGLKRFHKTKTKARAEARSARGKAMAAILAGKKRSRPKRRARK